MTQSPVCTAALGFVRTQEGGFNDDPGDPGNWTGGYVGGGQLRGTKYGISAKSYPTLDIANLTPDDADAILLTHYWVPCACDFLPPWAAVQVFDEAVNTGVGTAGVVLQQALGLYQDGVIGPITERMAVEANPAVGDEFLLRRLYHYGITYKFSTYGLGWMRRAIQANQLAKTLT